MHQNKSKRQNLRRSFVLLLLVGFSTALSYGQKHGAVWWDRLDDPTADFNQIVAEADSFFTNADSLEIALCPMPPKHFGYWYSFWRHRLDSNGSTRIDAYDGARDIYYDTNYCTTASSIPLWQEVGPTSVAEGSSSAKGTGFINEAWVKPSNHNIMIIGTVGGGLFKTTNGGQSWTDIMSATRIPGVAIRALEVNPVNENHIYVSIGDKGYGLGLLRSTDGGNSWCGTALTKNPQYNYEGGIPRKIVANKPGYFGEAYAMTKEYIYRTTNGFIFNNLCGTGSNTTVAIDSVTSGEEWINMARNQSGNVFYCSKSKIKRFDESNSTVTDITNNLNWNHPNTTGYGKLLLCTADDRPNHVFVIQSRTVLYDTLFIDTTLFGNPYIDTLYNFLGPHVSLYISSDNGNTFSEVVDYLQSTFSVPGLREDFAASLFNQNTFYLSGGIQAQRIWKNGSAWKYDENWSNVGNINASNYTHADVRDIDVLTAQGGYDEVFWSTDGGLFKSVYNIFDNVTDQDLSAWMVNGFVDVDGSDEIYCGVYHGGNNYRTRDGEWHITIGADGGKWAIGSGDPNNLIAGSNNALLRYNRNGDFISGNSLSAGQPWWQFVAFPVETKHNTVDSFLVGGNDLYLYDWSNNTYAANLTQNLNTNHIRDVKCHKANNNIIVFANNRYASSDSALFKSTNGGQTWTDISTNLSVSAPINAIFMHPDDPNEIWVGVDNFIDGQRVFVTYNNGSSWTNVSNDLWIYPVNDFAYDEVADILYAATDYGVYYLDKEVTNDKWHCYYKNLPTAYVTEIDVNYCTRKLVAATAGRGFHHVDLYQLSEHNNQNITWTNKTIEVGEEFYSAGDIDISGTVTIKGTVYMHDDAYINVPPNAKLIVDGGVISNSCGGLWGGIRAWGKNHQNETNQRPFHQFDNTKHGVVTIKNGARIENAKTGVLLGRDDINFRKGGIIYASNSEFYNNYQSIRFNSYHNYLPTSSHQEVNNVSSIKNCSFITEGALDDPQITEPNAQIYMNDIKGLYIRACTFADSTPWNSPYRSNYANRRIGIKSYISTYSVDPMCNNQQQYYVNSACWNQSNADSNIFYGYQQGISAENQNSLLPVTVRGARFENNRHSIVMWGCDLAEVYKNRFIHTPNAITAAMYVIGSTGYFIEENSYTSTGSNYGLIVSNGGPDANEVRNNYFEDIGTATQYQGDNDAFGDNNGAHHLCNEMVNTVRDLSVYGGDIALFQGYCSSGNNSNSTPANNIFSSSCYNVSHIDVYKPSTQPIYYSHLSGEAPICYDSDVYLTSCGAYQTGNGDRCPLSAKANPSTHLEKITDRVERIGDFINVIDSLSDAIDFRIVNDHPNSDVVDHMKSVAPLLKDSTLILAISGKPTPIDDGDLLSVLYRFAPLSDLVYEELYNRNPSLCNDIDNYVQQNNIVISPRTQEYLGIWEMEREIKKAQEEILRYYLVYDTTGGLDSALAFLKAQTGEWFRLKEFRLLMRMNDISNAQQLLSSIQQTYNGDRHLDEFMEWADISIKLAQDSSGAFLLQTDTLLEQRVRTLADTTKTAMVNYEARALLSLVFDEPQRIVEPADIEGGSGSSPFANTNDNATEYFEETNPEMLKLYPNPTKDQVVVAFDLPENVEKATIMVYSLQGRQVLSKEVSAAQKEVVMDVSGLKGGIYLYLLNADGEFVARRRLIISR